MSLFYIKSLQYFTCARLAYLVSCSYGALYLTLFLFIACRSSYQSGSLPRPRATVKPLPAHHRDLGRFSSLLTSVPDPNPDPPDPHVFWPPGSGSTSQRYGSGSGSVSFYHNAKIVRKTLIPTIL